MNETKLFTNNNKVIGYITCPNGEYGTFIKKEYKSIKNAIKYLKLAENEYEVYDANIMATLAQYKVLPPDKIGYLLSSCTTTDERLKHVYTPILIGLIVCELAQKAISMLNELGLNKGAIKQQCRECFGTSNKFTTMLKLSLKSSQIYNNLLQRRNEMLNDVSMPIMILTLQLDNEIMKQEPRLEYHNLIAQLETIIILCDYIIFYDKGFSKLISKRSGLSYNTKQDINITKIKTISNILIAKLMKGYKDINFNGTEVNGINNIELAFKSLDKHIINSKWIDAII